MLQYRQDNAKEGHPVFSTRLQQDDRAANYAKQMHLILQKPVSVNVKQPETTFRSHVK